MWRRTALGLATTSKPAIATCPDVGRASVHSTLIVVDLPAPFGPRNANTSPSCTSKLMASTAVKSPNRRVRSRTSTMLVGDGPTEGTASVSRVTVFDMVPSWPPERRGASVLSSYRASVLGRGNRVGSARPDRLRSDQMYRPPVVRADPQAGPGRAGVA